MKENNVPKLTFALTATAALCAAVLAAAAHATKQPIEAAKAKATAEALRALEPDFDNIPPAEAFALKNSEGVEAVFYPIKKGGVLIAVIAKCAGRGGYAGEIETLLSMTPAGVVKKVIVTSHKETPGLGTAVTDRIAQKTILDVLNGRKTAGLPPNKFLDQFSGKSLAEDGAPGALPAAKWQVRKDGGGIDEITGATVSGRAVARGVRDALTTFNADRAAILSKFSGTTERLSK